MRCCKSARNVRRVTSKFWLRVIAFSYRRPKPNCLPKSWERRSWTHSRTVADEESVQCTRLKKIHCSNISSCLQALIIWLPDWLKKSSTTNYANFYSFLGIIRCVCSFLGRVFRLLFCLRNRFFYEELFIWWNAVWIQSVVLISRKAYEERLWLLKKAGLSDTYSMDAIPLFRVAFSKNHSWLS